MGQDSCASCKYAINSTKSKLIRFILLIKSKIIQECGDTVTFEVGKLEEKGNIVFILVKYVIQVFLYYWCRC